LAASRKLPGEVELEVGIAAGKVAVGVCGHRTLRRKDVFGDAVNQAATIGHYCGVAITGPVYERVGASCATRRLPDFDVKWQREPLKVWAVVE
jgi:class 3 adenylate cyclase